MKLRTSIQCFRHLKRVGYHLTKSLKSGNLPSNIGRNIVSLLRASWRAVRGQLPYESLWRTEDDRVLQRRSVRLQKIFLGNDKWGPAETGLCFFIGEMRRLFSKDWILLPQAKSQWDSRIWVRVPSRAPQSQSSLGTLRKFEGREGKEVLECEPQT